MSVPSVPAPSPEVKIPNGDPGVIYREVVGWIGYAVGDDGSLWSCWGRSHQWHKLTPNFSDGYPRFMVSNNGRSRRERVYTFVLEAFVGPCPEGMECCHYPDESRSNCRLSNIRWDTRKNNNSDRVKHGTAWWQKKKDQFRPNVLRICLTENERELLDKVASGPTSTWARQVLLREATKATLEAMEV